MDQRTLGGLADWGAGLLIGLMPLGAHALVHFGFKPAPDFESNWAPDILFMAISIAGLSGLTTFSRILKGEHNTDMWSPGLKMIMGLTLVCFAFASLDYGGVVAGFGNGNTIYVALFFLLISSGTSLLFELVLAWTEE